MAHPTHNNNRTGTSRTGTTRWKALRTQAIRQAQRNGANNCPLCHRPITWDAPRDHPRAPQADHITPYALGGKDTPNNIRIICRSCNQTLGGKLGGKRASKATSRKPIPPAKPIEFDHGNRW